uniref:Uncharacterized protein n=1 Tax=Chromera velia CCMP2878 TaxID=1169474 RepID=A0A0G4G1R8_9ALVE|eukprot:Cvel_4026.t1-p1 / transcript=Cvel_4026.t1 / gene=Cvel_4026 / organism=Chromera_velia_CCMP2878 / gene_product=hypothetical protein / transcript_product=hypothetical protein / location=Cvel_scaffold171:61423-61695(+) / protein_length=91 / sequence_SO=supercontig / SO=protein_coding / is_pseudo=false
MTFFGLWVKRKDVEALLTVWGVEVQKDAGASLGGVVRSEGMETTLEGAVVREDTGASLGGAASSEGVEAPLIGRCYGTGGCGGFLRRCCVV